MYEKTHLSWLRKIKNIMLAQDISDSMIFTNKNNYWNWIISVNVDLLSVVSKAHARATWCAEEPAKKQSDSNSSAMFISSSSN